MSNTPIYPVYEQKMRDKIDELQSDNARLQSLTTEQAAEIERLKIIAAEKSAELNNLRYLNERLMKLIRHCSVYEEISSESIECRACGAKGITDHTMDHRSNCEYIALTKGRGGADANRN